MLALHPGSVHISRMSATEIERAVQELPAQEFASFAAWFQGYLSDRWDERIEQDIAAGRLDHIAAKADADFDQGLCKPL